MKGVWEWILAALAILLLFLVWQKRPKDVAARVQEPPPLAVRDP